MFMVEKTNISATIFVASLKNDATTSNTVKLSKLVAKELATYDVDVKIVYMGNKIIGQGVSIKSEEPDDQAQTVIYDRIEKSDIVILATPIWWGQQSSLAQKFMERVGAYDDQYIKSGKSPLYGKVFGCIVTASNDGFQHAQGNMYNFASELGFTIPPEAHVNWGTELGKLKNVETLNQVKNSARNLYLWASTLKKVDLGRVALAIKPGRVGLLSNDKLASSK